MINTQGGRFHITTTFIHAKKTIGDNYIPKEQMFNNHQKNPHV
jgi:hypothetical protein